jgi:activating signal cointegrator complex subunit 3
VDFESTDLLQMIGRAGRPQFDDRGVAVVYCENSKKNFYRKFLNDPFPIESSLLGQIADHVNAEIARGEINNTTECI